MCRFLREQDRAAHSDCYPKLYYPEIYVLHGGYKAFYEEMELNNVNHNRTDQCYINTIMLISNNIGRKPICGDGINHGMEKNSVDLS